MSECNLNSKRIRPRTFSAGSILDDGVPMLMKLINYLLRFMSKCRRSGIRETVRLSKNLIARELHDLIWRLQGVKQLKAAGYKVVFPCEGNVIIELPRLKTWEALIGSRAAFCGNAVSFLGRPYQELLLRKVVFTLFQTGVVSRQLSVIDIGAWISDNALVWAKLLDSGCAQVFAIDPSPGNIQFGREVGLLNRITNVSYHQAVCSSEAGTPLYPIGKLSHTEFTETPSPRKTPVVSTTIDAIVGEERIGAIGLFHIDVEGFEKQVLLGADKVLRKSRPAVLFEQHVDDDVCEDVFDFLWERSYVIYMINELLPGCRKDCRNFLAVSAGIDFDPVLSCEDLLTAHQQVRPVQAGPPLILVGSVTD